MSTPDHLSPTIELALLGYLSERPMHGYDIYLQTRGSSGLGLAWNLKRSQLYALLAKLEGAGYIAASVEPQEGRPPRRVFRLTEAGRNAFEAWLTSPVSRPRDLRLDFLARLYFARRNSQDAVLQLVRRQRVLCAEWLAEYTARAEACQADRPYEWLVWQFRMNQTESILRWLDACAQAPGEHVDGSPVGDNR